MPIDTSALAALNARTEARREAAETRPDLFVRVPGSQRVRIARFLTSPAGVTRPGHAALRLAADLLDPDTEDSYPRLEVAAEGEHDAPPTCAEAPDDRYPAPTTVTDGDDTTRWAGPAGSAVVHLTEIRRCPIRVVYADEPVTIVQAVQIAGLLQAALHLEHRQHGTTDPFAVKRVPRPWDHSRAFIDVDDHDDVLVLSVGVPAVGAIRLFGSIVDLSVDQAFQLLASLGDAIDESRRQHRAAAG